MAGSRLWTRRTLLATGGVAVLAGCLDDTGGETFTRSRPVAESGTEPADLPLRDPAPPSADGFASLLDAVASGGVSKDGIPSVDEPRFIDAEAADARFGADEIVFGLETDDGGRAYPQRILVWHEIVNDRVGGEGLSITYCPLTGTAVCFERGTVEFGVTGRLVNSNLIMYDRATESWWPQILGTAIDGPLVGRSLSERPLVWTTWERWRATHPDTDMLSEETGFIRSYDRDPYGTLHPPTGYYAEDFTLFPSIRRDDRFHPKSVVFGVRTADGAGCVTMERLRARGIVTLDLGAVPYLLGYDPSLDVGYAFRNPTGEAFQSLTGGFGRRGRVLPDPSAVPLERVNAFEAMWFAWHAFYPRGAVVG